MAGAVSRVCDVHHAGDQRVDAHPQQFAGQSEHLATGQVDRPAGLARRDHHGVRGAAHRFQVVYPQRTVVRDQVGKHRRCRHGGVRARRCAPARRRPWHRAACGRLRRTRSARSRRGTAWPAGPPPGRRTSGSVRQPARRPRPPRTDGRGIAPTRAALGATVTDRPRSVGNRDHSTPCSGQAATSTSGRSPRTADIGRISWRSSTSLTRCSAASAASIDCGRAKCRASRRSRNGTSCSSCSIRLRRAERVPSRMPPGHHGDRGQLAVHAQELHQRPGRRAGRCHVPAGSPPEPVRRRGRCGCCGDPRRRACATGCGPRAPRPPAGRSGRSARCDSRRAPRPAVRAVTSRSADRSWASSAVGRWACAESSRCAARERSAQLSTSEGRPSCTALRSPSSASAVTRCAATAWSSVAPRVAR